MYSKHANALLQDDGEVDAFLQRALAATLDDSLSVEDLIALTMETGKHGVSSMALLDKANTEAYGNPEITKVNIGVGKNPGILVSGHDLRDLEMLLEQTQGTGVDVYTHSEMLPAHYYPAFKKYSNFIGNYGNAWWKQKEEFESFNGPILMTTNCIVPPKDSYNDSYSLAVIALKLKEVFDLDDINDLPIAYNIAWYEQKAVIVLLALLYLGVKNIHLGPTLPAFLSPNVAKVLIENFGIAGRCV